VDHSSGFYYPFGMSRCAECVSVCQYATVLSCRSAAGTGVTPSERDLPRSDHPKCDHPRCDPPRCYHSSLLQAYCLQLHVGACTVSQEVFVLLFYQSIAAVVVALSNVA
jgi:hypothetical protein